MGKEWQVDIAKTKWPENIEGIVIGDEGCIYRSLDLRWISWVERALNRNVALRYLTPPVPNKNVEELFNYIVNLTTLTTPKVSFNDFGMLYRCQELIKRKKIIPVLGRIITRSILDCPWYKELLKNENPELITAITGSNFVHRSKWEVLRQFDIDEIELNITNNKDASHLKEMGFRLTYYKSNILVSVGRICYSARWQGLELPKCCNNHSCRTELIIEIDKKWGKQKLMFEDPVESVKEKYQNLFVKGNIVFKYPRENLNIPEALFNNIII